MSDDETEQAEPKIPWADASIADLAAVDPNQPLEGVLSADQHDLASIFAHAAAGQPETPVERVYGVIGAVMGMHFKPQDTQEPFGPMAVLGGRRSPIPSDFLPLVNVLREIVAKFGIPSFRLGLGMFAG